MGVRSVVGGREERATLQPLFGFTHSSSQSWAHHRMGLKITLDSGFLSSLATYFRNQETLLIWSRKWADEQKLIIANIWRAYYVPGTAAKCFQLITLWIPTLTVWGKNYYYTYFTNDEPEAQFEYAICQAECSQLTICLHSNFPFIWKLPSPWHCTERNLCPFKYCLDTAHVIVRGFLLPLVTCSHQFIPSTVC